MSSIEERLKQHARRLGFDLAGIAPAQPADSFAELEDWLAQGYAGEMGYLHRHGEARRHPSSILPDVRSVVMVALNYNPAACGLARAGAESGAKPQAVGRVARYALGADYHDVLREKLKALLDWIEQEVPGSSGRAVVDTAPLLERDF